MANENRDEGEEGKFVGVSERTTDPYDLTIAFEDLMMSSYQQMIDGYLDYKGEHARIGRVSLQVPAPGIEYHPRKVIKRAGIRVRFHPSELLRQIGYVDATLGFLYAAETPRIFVPSWKPEASEIETGLPNKLRSDTEVVMKMAGFEIRREG